MVDRNVVRKGLPGLAAVVVAAAIASALPERADDGDHALLSRYPGSTVTSKTAKEFESYTLVEGLHVDGMKFSGRPLEGQVALSGFTAGSRRIHSSSVRYGPVFRG